MTYVYIDAVMVTLQILVITFNGFIIYMFYRVKHLYSNAALRLTFFVAVTDFLHAFTTLPYTIYLTIFCAVPPINLDPYFIMFSSMPLTIQLKVKLTLTAAIALQRNLALFMPLLYRRLSSATYATLSLLLGIMFAAVDLFLEFLLTPIKESPNCGAIGCFVSDEFLYYWGASNLDFYKSMLLLISKGKRQNIASGRFVLYLFVTSFMMNTILRVIGFVVVIFSLIILLKLHLIGKTSSGSVNVRGDGTSRKYRQANQSSLGILITSLLFITIPSVGVGFMEMIGCSIFRKLGPFYIVGLLCAGTSNSIVCIVFNRDMRKHVKNIVTESVGVPPSRMFQSTVDN